MSLSINKAIAASRSTGNLALGGRNLREIPEAVWNNEIELPDAQTKWWEVADVVKADLSRNAIQIFPDGFIQSLTLLTSLDLSHNKLTKLPEDFTPLSDLRSLNVASNSLVTLPASIAYLERLATLNVSQNALVTLPSNLGSNQPALAVVIACQNQIQCVPPGLAMDPGLIKLDLSKNKIQNLDDRVLSSGFRALVELDLSENLLSGTLNPSIGSLGKVQILRLSRNKIQTLPAQIQHCSALIELYLGSNALTSLPSTLGQLSNLKTLELADNKLPSIPDSVCDLNLGLLDLRNNDLLTLPPRLSRMAPTLRAMPLEGNVLRGVPRSLISGPVSALLKHLAMKLPEDEEDAEGDGGGRRAEARNGGGGEVRMGVVEKSPLDQNGSWVQNNGIQNNGNQNGCDYNQGNCNYNHHRQKDACNNNVIRDAKTQGVPHHLSTVPLLPPPQAPPGQPNRRPLEQRLADFKSGGAAVRSGNVFGLKGADVAADLARKIQLSGSSGHELVLKATALKFIPPEIWEAGEAVALLDVSQNKELLDIPPKGLSKLRKLKTLVLSDTGLAMWPLPFPTSSDDGDDNFIFLDLKDLQMRQIFKMKQSPPMTALLSTPNLKRFDLSGTPCLAPCPATLAFLAALPCYCPRLEELRLAQTGLSLFPLSTPCCPLASPLPLLSPAPPPPLLIHLRVLDVSSNRIAALPNDIDVFSSALEELFLANNDLNGLPPSLGLMGAESGGKLHALTLEGNPIRSIRRAIIEKGTLAVLEYLRGKIGA
uniref:Uncharacterized protein n=1 Tax=Polytomella parva TaxID=51329 RepID=A0A7S0YIR7_9CHLO|mmetsp:Transcript_28848/g.52989  ORF Transcript_28848/g.52989 Transcript_28848/m.52989 type:complete len:766 (+) Transcript_28848:46-2343(+)